MSQHVPVVLIPGFMSDAVSWTHQFEALSSDSEVIIPGGHYELPSMQEMARHIAQELPEQFDVVGWSMGGYIAFELYRVAKDRIRKLALVSTTARPETSESAQRRAEVLAAVSNKGIRAVWSQLLDKLLYEPGRVDIAFKMRIVEAAEKLGEHVLRSQTTAIIERRDARPDLETMGCETLIVAGQHDVIVPMEQSIEMNRSMIHSRLHVIRQAGHCSPWEQPEQINNLLRTFFA